MQTTTVTSAIETPDRCLLIAFFHPGLNRQSAPNAPLIVPAMVSEFIWTRLLIPTNYEEVSSLKSGYGASDFPCLPMRSPWMRR